MTKTLRILLVDHYEDLVESMSQMLRREGHLVATAHDGCGAILLSAAVEPDIVLLDLHLPEISGYNVAKRIRSRMAPAPTLIALSGFSGEAHRQRALAAGFDAYLPKPVDFGMLRELIQQAGGRAFQNRQQAAGRAFQTRESFMR